MSAYYSQNAPLEAPYQNLPIASPSDNAAGNYPAMPNGGPSRTNDSDADIVDPPTGEPAEQARRCSVRGCVSIIPADSTNKMCEACRGRHRVYAMTKRAKRKMEKDALNQQSVALLSTEQPPGTVWLPETPDLDDGEPGDDSISGVGRTDKLPDQPSQPVVASSVSHASNSIPVQYGAPPWDHTVLDPRLVSSQSSELAGALTLPTQSVLNAAMPSHSSAESNTVPTQNDHASSSSSQAAEDGPDSHHDVDAPYIAPAGAQSSSSSASRYCSVKGCKAMISGDYFFKMCEPCRDRYRGYGITKRAKWRAERVAANAELEALRIEEDKRRADEGLPPLADSPEDWIAWQNDLVEGPLLIQTEDKYGPFPARMCTVSHCHAILPGQYKYRRCEQHRLQNRHHSKLKRVREKEVKAQAAALASEPSDEFRIWAPRGESSKKKVDDEVGPLFTNVPMELDRNVRAESGDVSEAGDETAGTPSVAGGARRTNHVCSIKGCHNLLAPQVPWKMCDNCREHDRENRKNKKLRDLGQLPPLRFQTHTGILKKGGRSKGAFPKFTVGAPTGTLEPTSTSAAPVTSTLLEDTAAGPSSPRTSSSNDADEVSTDLMPPEGSANNISSSGMDENINTFQQNEAPAPPTTTTRNDTSGRANTPSSNAIDTTGPTAPEPSEDPQPHKKRGKSKTKEPHEDPPTKKRGKGKDATTAAAAPPTDSQASGSNPAPMPFPYAYGTHMHPPYQVPYYMPPPHYNVPAQPPVPATSASASTSQTGSSQAPPAHQMYPYPPQPYGHYPPYGSHPYGQYPYPYPPQQYNPSQPHMQPYGSTVYPGVTPYSYSPPQNPLQNPPPQKPQTIKPVQRRKRRRDDQELPGPNGSTSYTSVFSARYTSPVPTPDPKPVSNVETSLPEEATSEHDVTMAAPQQNDTTVSAVDEATSIQRKCVNQSCHRDLPASTNGTFCERCRDRMKKRQMKAKHRFKLEPRKSIVRPGTVGKEGNSIVDDSSGKEVEA